MRGNLSKTSQRLTDASARTPQVREPDIGDAAWIARHVGNSAASPLRPQDFYALAQVLEVKKFDAGDVLFEAGDVPTEVLILREGTVAISVGSGRHRVVIDVLHPGAVAGDIALLRRTQFSFAAHALEPCTCLSIGCDAFARLLAGHPTIALRWLSSVADRLSAAQDRHVAILKRPLPAQVAHLLVDESLDGPVRLTQGTLAAMLGVQRPSLNKVLKEFERDGLIAIRYAGIDILDADGLMAHAE